jgi:hypothetical protein
MEVPMKSAIQAGVVLGLLVLVWTLIHGFTGWYKDPGMSWTFWMVIPFQVILLVWMLKNTKKQGFGYGQQVVAGLVMSLVAGAIIFVGSWLITTAVFPTYYADMQAMAEKVLAAKGLTPEQIAAAMDKEKAMMTPMGSSITAFIGTTITGLVVALIAAVLIRNKGTVATA